jgi:hypothetical protein
MNYNQKWTLYHHDPDNEDWSEESYKKIGTPVSFEEMFGIDNNTSKEILDESKKFLATKKLNEDLKILGTLQNQSIKLTDIKSLLDSIVPKDLIDQQNLDDALEKIKKMMLLLAGGLGTINLTGGPGGGTNFGIKDVPKIEKLTGKESIGAILEYSDAVTTLANVMADTLDAENYQNYLSLIEYQKKLGDFGGYSTSMASGAGSSSYGYSPVVTVEVIDKTSGLIEVVQNAVQENNRFGNNLNFAGAL